MIKLTPVLLKSEIERGITTVARKISADYEGSELVLLGVLKGAFIFMADLCRQITVGMKIDFIGASSYGPGMISSGKIHLTKTPDIDLNGKHILVVEDIVDTGLTLRYVVDYLLSFNPKSVKVCALINKLERRECKIPVDYACHIVERGFLVGYGLDCDELYRNLPDIYHLKTSIPGKTKPG